MYLVITTKDTNKLKLKSVFNLLQNSNIRNFLSISTASLIVKLLNLFIVGYPARILGPENYGIITFSLSIIAYLSIIILPGMQTWGTKNIAHAVSRTSKILSVVLITRFFLATFCYIILLFFTYYFIDSRAEKVIILITALTLLTNSLTLDWVFNGMELMFIPSILSVIQTLLNIFLLFKCVRTEQDLYTYAVISPVINFVTIISGLLILHKKGIKFKLPSLLYIYISIKDSLMLGISMSLIIILHYANNLIVKFYLGAKSLGIFMASFYILELASTIPAIFSTIFLSRIIKSNIISIENGKSNSDLYLKIILLFAFITSTFVFFEANNIVHFLYGNKYDYSVILLKIMSIGIFFNFLISCYTNILLAYHFDKIIINVVLISAIVSLVGGMLVIPHFGIIGASYVISSIDLFGWLIALYYYRKVFKTFNFSLWIKPILFIIFFSCVLYNLHLRNFNFLTMIFVYFIFTLISILFYFKNDLNAFIKIPLDEDNKN